MNLVLESERLLLRPLEPGDRDLGMAMFTDPAVMRYLAETYTPAKVDWEMTRAVRRCAGGCIGVWCVIERASGEKIGTGVLLPMPIDGTDTDWDQVAGDALPDSEIEIGYLLKPAAWGKGYATEVCTRLLRFAFQDSPLQEVVAVTDPQNLASQRVLVKSGLVSEGLRRAYGTQCPGFRLTRAQWLERHARES